MFPLIETIQIFDGQPQHLPYHQHRFEASYFKVYKTLTNIKLDEVIQVPETYRQGLVKLRFLYNQTDCFCQYDLYTPKDINNIKLIYNDDIQYDIKWVNRTQLNLLKQQKGTADDILIVKNQRVTDTSFTNIIFYDGKRWFTPKYPLLHGTTRARLLNKKIIEAKDIFVDDLKHFTHYKLINAMRGFDAPALPINSIQY